MRTPSGYSACDGGHNSHCLQPRTVIGYRPQMNRTTQTICLSVLLAGCWKEPCPGDLIAQGIYRLDANTDEVTGVEATLVGNGRELVLSGRLLARHHPNGPVTAKGEVYLVSPDGEVISQQPLVFARTHTAAAPTRRRHSQSQSPSRRPSARPSRFGSRPNRTTRARPPRQFAKWCSGRRTVLTRTALPAAA